MRRLIPAVQDDDGYPWHCQAHPRPDQTLPADALRRDALATVLAIGALIVIVLASSIVPA